MFPRPTRHSRLFSPERLWVKSSRLHSRGHRRAARLLKAANFLLFRAVLPPEAGVADDVRLGHYGMGVVIHPNVSIRSGVHIWHNVTIATRTAIGGPGRINVLEDVEIGAGALIVSPSDRVLTIGAGARIGAGAVVVSDVPPGATVVAPVARPLPC